MMPTCTATRDIASEADALRKGYYTCLANYGYQKSKLYTMQNRAQRIRFESRGTISAEQAEWNARYYAKVGGQRKRYENAKAALEHASWLLKDAGVILE
jgi:hypothetical protein